MSDNQSEQAEKTVNFLIWLHKVKGFDAMSIIKVIEKPDEYQDLYDKFVDYITE